MKQPVDRDRSKFLTRLGELFLDNQNIENELYADDEVCMSCGVSDDCLMAQLTDVDGELLYIWLNCSDCIEANHPNDYHPALDGDSE